MESFCAYLAQNIAGEDRWSISQPDYLTLRHPYHRPPITGLDQLTSPLPAGFRSLVFNYRLSVPVITLINRVVTEERYISQIVSCQSDQSSWTPNGANMQEAEYAARLLASTDLTLVERSVCIGILISTLGRTRTERFSALYIQNIQHHAEELGEWQDMFQAPDLGDFYLWAAMEISATMMSPNAPVLSSKHQNDSRLKLLMVVMRNYGHMRWDEALEILNKFIVVPRCAEIWHSSWNLGMKHVQKHGLAAAGIQARKQAA